MRWWGCVAGGQYTFSGLSQPEVSYKANAIKTTAKGFRRVTFQDGTAIEAIYPFYYMRGTTFFTSLTSRNPPLPQTNTGVLTQMLSCARARAPVSVHRHALKVYLCTKAPQKYDSPMRPQASQRQSVCNSSRVRGADTDRDTSDNNAACRRVRDGAVYRPKAPPCVRSELRAGRRRRDGSSAVSSGFPVRYHIPVPSSEHQ